ncbi:substrate-binding periplasmic protein [Shewanella sp.]|uniref:substrate-binding periplasmic protein n=1 Tax=Shewanella sp. TaxID=50422 RepID=UPI0035653B60
MRMLLFALLLTPVFAFSNNIDLPVLKYSVSGSSSWYPYYIPNNSENPGLISELLPALFTHAHIQGQNIPLPPNRTNQALDKGTLDFDIVSPSWFEHGNFGPLFVKSDPIMTITEYVITLPQNQSDWLDITKIKNREVGTVMGYLYHDDGDFTRIDFKSEQELIKALHRGRIQAAISGDNTALYWSAKLELPIALAAEHSSGDLVFRLRKERANLLPAINEAIATLKANGTIDRLINKYTHTLDND